MNNLILPNDIYGVTEKSGIPVVSSRRVADVFGKPHDNVLKSVRNLVEGLVEISESEWQNNFILSRYKNSQNKHQPEYLLTKKGFTLLAVGFSGKKALKFKIQYIDKFEKMETFIRNLYEAKVDFPEFTQAIMASHEEPKHYHFSNELDMINRIVLGMSTKQFKETRDLGKVSSIRPHLTSAQIESIKVLQRIDIGLIVAVPDFQERKRILTEQLSRRAVKAIA